MKTPRFTTREGVAKTTKAPKAKSNIVPKAEKSLMPEHYTADTLAEMREKWDKQSMASALDDRVRRIEKQEKYTFIELGLILTEVETGELWKLILPETKGDSFHSFDAWLSDAAPVCRSSAYLALKAVRELKDIPTETLAMMPRCNVGLLVKVPRQHRNPDVIEAGTKLNEQAFRGYVAREVPEAHLEEKRPMRFSPEESQRKVIDTALESAMLLDPDLVTREEALESICEDWLLANQDVLEAKAKASGAGNGD